MWSRLRGSPWARPNALRTVDVRRLLDDVCGRYAHWIRAGQSVCGSSAADQPFQRFSYFLLKLGRKRASVKVDGGSS